VAVVVGSGIMVARQSPGDTGLSTGALGRRSGTGLPGRDVAAYAAAQGAGGIGGAVLANLMFALPAVAASGTARPAPHLWLGEVVATAGLVLVVFALARSGRGALAPPAAAGVVPPAVS
jgi:glycerol uptake facilitator-like aquaporin